MTDNIDRTVKMHDIIKSIRRFKDSHIATIEDDNGNLRAVINFYWYGLGLARAVWKKGCELAIDGKSVSEYIDDFLPDDQCPNHVNELKRSIRNYDPTLSSMSGDGFDNDDDTSAICANPPLTLPEGFIKQHVNRSLSTEVSGTWTGLEGHDYVICPTTGQKLHPKTLLPIEKHVDFSNIDILSGGTKDDSIK